MQFMFWLFAVACTPESPPSVAPSALEADPADPFTDLDPSPTVFEAELTAKQSLVDIGGAVVEMLTYGAQLPGPEIRVVQGDRVIIHLDNQLPDDFPTTIHWHGIEGSNASDGTPTTQPAIQPGESFTYDFVAPRPGIYWYHPHIRGAQATHSGLYAPLIVDDPDDATLVEMGVLPRTRYTMVLSDLGIYEGGVIDVESDDGMVIMNGSEGDTLLVNGKVLPTYEVPAGDGVRLQLVNTSIARYWRVSAPGHTLFRVGGEGGLLNHVRVEGGTELGQILDHDGDVVGETTVDLGYLPGEILLGPAERADVVLVPTGEPGDQVRLRWEDFARGRHGMWLEGDEMIMGDAPDDGTRPGADVAILEIVEGSGDYTIDEGDDVLAALGREAIPVDLEQVNVDFTGDSALELQETMEMVEQDGRWEHIAGFYIDGESWMPQPTGPDQPLAPSARFAAVGDTILWDVTNTTAMSHPFHLHGFSFQPLAFFRAEGDADHDETTGTDQGDDQLIRTTLDYVEFEDTAHIPANTTLRMAVRIDDPNADGGALGRWMSHCHIFQHGEAGMMSELVVE